MIRYSEEQIQAAIMLLNNLEVKGIENSKKVVMLSNILNNGVKEEPSGSQNEL